MMKCRIASLCLAAFALAVPGLPAVADDFYKGKTIDMIVGVPPGGGYDLYARTLVRFMGKHIPGNPSFVVKNMPGASSLHAANAIYNVLPQDGTVIGAVQRGAPLVPLLYPDNMSPRFKADKFHWLGSPQKELGLLLIARNSPAQTINELKQKEVAVSSTGRGSATSVFPRVLNAVLGTKFKVIEGYPGSQEALFAMEQGEVQGHASGGSSAKFRGRIRPWLQKGDVKVMMQIGFNKDDAFPDAPLVFDLVKNPEDLKLLRLVFTPQLMGRPFLVGPKVPMARVKILRAAFDATMRDPGFLALAKKLRMDVNPVSGEEINQILSEVYSAPPALIKRVRDIVNKNKK